MVDICVFLKKLEEYKSLGLELSRMWEDDTIADYLTEYPTALPSFDELVQEILDIEFNVPKRCARRM